MAAVMYSSVMFVHEEEEDLALGGLGRSNGPAQLGRFLFFNSFFSFSVSDFIHIFFILAPNKFKSISRIF
jgi:hypothetical protein